MAHNTFPSPRQARTLARGLGWFSLGLGVVGLLAARRVARAAGLPGQAGLVAAFGVREVVTGIGLLRGGQPARWLWVRVAGDALDATALATGLRKRQPAGTALGLGLGLAAVTGVAVVDLACARALSRRPPAPAADYSGRSGWPLPPADMRGAAREDFEPPRDMRIPQALRPWPRAGRERASAALHRRLVRQRLTARARARPERPGRLAVPLLRGHLQRIGSK